MLAQIAEERPEFNVAYTIQNLNHVNDENGDHIIEGLHLAGMPEE